MGNHATRNPAVPAQLGLVLGTVAYLVMALACLREGGRSNPWSRLDMFSGGFLALLLLSSGIGLRIGRPLFGSSGALRQAAGIAYDRVTLLIAPALAAGDALVFLDYGRWHLTRALEQASLQAVGLALGAAAMAWIVRTDAQLVRHFEDAQSAHALMTTGPFRYIRHPRYAGILGVRAAYALTFASAIGWGLAATWLIVLLRRIRLEEGHLRTEFGESYDRYAARTSRLIPGLY
jgi:protein-S-isoprenylcysteine O-methyltransferase Ste14